MRKLSKKAKSALLHRVARHMRRWPQLFDFSVWHIPGRGCKACMLGRAGAMLGLKPRDETVFELDRIAAALGFNGQSEFYDTVEDVCGPTSTPDYDLWVDTPRLADALDKLAGAK